MSEMHGRLAIHPLGYQVPWWSWGEGDDVLVGLHGGIGAASHMGLDRLWELAGPELRVVLYDQTGSGDADAPDDQSLWRVDRYVEELDSLHDQLGLRRIHLFGHSWGGMLALQYALDRPQNVASLIVCGSGPSGPEMVKAVLRRRLDLDSTSLMRMWRYEMNGQTSDPKYLAAVDALYRDHVQRVSEKDRATKDIGMPSAPAEPSKPYVAMWGPNEFCPTSEVLEWDVSKRLGEIAVPTLILTGLHDHVSLACHQALSDGIADSELVIFGNSSHCPFREHESASCLATLKAFIERNRVATETRSV